MTLSLPPVPGPMPMPQAPVRFMIACAARTGSTMLVRTLRSHPGVVMHGEVWGDAMVGLDGPLARECEADPAVFAALDAARFQAPAETLQRFLDAQGAQAVGFKLKFDELVRPQWSGIRGLVEADTGLRIVFLHRQDLLRRYLSHQIVLRQTGITNVPAGGALPDIAPFVVDVEDCLRDIAETRARTHEFEAAFAAHPSMQLAYEELAADPQAACDRVFGFLGIAPVAVRVATERIVRAPPEALVLNYDELRAALDAAGETIAA